MNAIGVLRRRLLLERVARGEGSDGRKLKSRADGKPSFLRKSGRLLGGIRVIADDTSVRVAPTAQYAPYVERDRPFVGATGQEQAEVDREVIRRLGIRERELDKRRRRR